VPSPRAALDHNKGAPTRAGRSALPEPQPSGGLRDRLALGLGVLARLVEELDPVGDEVAPRARLAVVGLPLAPLAGAHDRDLAEPRERGPARAFFTPTHFRHTFDVQPRPRTGDGARR
jgi:hypothetical protein